MLSFEKQYSQKYYMIRPFLSLFFEHNRPVNLHPDIRWTWYFLGSGTLKNIRLHQPYFFRLWTIFLCNSKEKRPGYLFSFWITKKSWLYFHSISCTPYFGPYIFQGCKPTHVFKYRIVGANSVGDWDNNLQKNRHSYGVL